MPPVDKRLPIFKAKNLKVLEEGLEKTEVQPQEEKNKANNENELRGKFTIFSGARTKI